MGPPSCIIQDVRPTCGCTVASFDSTIAPGATGKIHAEVDTIDFSGAIAKTITVLSNDPTTPRLTLTVKAVVLPQVEVHPGFARYIYVQNHDPGQLKQWLWTDNFADFKVTEVVSPYKFITATFRQAKSDERRSEIAGNTNQWIVETTIQPNAEVGALREFLIVKTNHPKQKELRIPITGFVRPVMSVTPYIADFGTIDVAESAKDLSLILVNFGDELIDIKSVTTSTPGVETSVKSIEAGRRFEIKVALTSKMPKGAINSVLKIETTSTRKPTVDVPLEGQGVLRPRRPAGRAARSTLARRVVPQAALASRGRGLSRLAAQLVDRRQGPGERLQLKSRKRRDAGEPEIDERVELGAREAALLAGALDLDDLARGRGHDVEVDLRAPGPRGSRDRAGRVRRRCRPKPRPPARRQASPEDRRRHRASRAPKSPRPRRRSSRRCAFRRPPAARRNRRAASVRPAASSRRRRAGSGRSGAGSRRSGRMGAPAPPRAHCESPSRAAASSTRP